MWGYLAHLGAVKGPFWRRGTGSSGIVEVVAIAGRGQNMPKAYGQRPIYMLHYRQWWRSGTIEMTPKTTPVQGVAV